MRRRWLWIVLALVVCLPIVEVTLFIALGNWIGYAWTLLILLAGFVLGVWLFRREGPRAIHAMREAQQENRPPGREMIDGALIALGGALMVFPGVASDVLGLLMILPPTRAGIRRIVVRMLENRLSPTVASQMLGPRRVRVRRAPRHGPAEPTADPEPIEGEILGPEDPGPRPPRG